MPSLNFTLPHWLYWVGLIAFPLIAMVMSRRARAERHEYSTALGYMILATGGILGMHRFYLKNLVGLIYIPVFLFILYANGQEGVARQDLSTVANQVRVAERTLEREVPRLEADAAAIDGVRAEVAETEEGSFARRSIERRVERLEAGIVSSRERIAESEAAIAELTPARSLAIERLARWDTWGGYAFWLIALFMLVDAVLLPGLVRRANARLPEEDEVTEAELALRAAEAEEGPKSDADHAENWVDRLSLFAGEFAAYWAVIAVFVYYYEVIARYVFNSPTNWAHESMYLMFGMQYLIAGSYAMLTESHVRVDIFYAPLPKKRKAIVDLATSIFFFIFAGTLLATSWIFAMDALAVPTGNSVVSDWARGEYGLGTAIANFDTGQWTDPNIRWGEISFNEWEVPLWPMKWVMVLGGVLLVLQGVSKVSKDIRAIARENSAWVLILASSC